MCKTALLYYVSPQLCWLSSLTSSCGLAVYFQATTFLLWSSLTTLFISSWNGLFKNSYFQQIPMGRRIASKVSLPGASDLVRCFNSMVPANLADLCVSSSGAHSWPLRQPAHSFSSMLQRRVIVLAPLVRDLTFRKYIFADIVWDLSIQPSCHSLIFLSLLPPLCLQPISVLGSLSSAFWILWIQIHKILDFFGFEYVLNIFNAFKANFLEEKWKTLIIPLCPCKKFLFLISFTILILIRVFSREDWVNFLIFCAVDFLK